MSSKDFALSSAPAGIGNKIVAKMMTNKIQFLAAKQADPALKSMDFGILFARVSGIKEKVDDRTTTVHRALVGSFEFRPFAAMEAAPFNMKPIRSGVLYLPDGIQAQIEAVWEKANTGADGKRVANPMAVEFAVVPRLIEDTGNGHGFTYEFGSIEEPSAKDDLSELRETALQRLADAAAKALPAPETVRPAKKSAAA